MIYSNKILINGSIISKKFKIYNLCDYSFYNFKQLKRTQLFKDYILLKINNISEDIKNNLLMEFYKVLEILNSQIKINDDFIIDDFNNIIYKLIVDGNIDEEMITVEKMLNYIVDHTKDEYIVVNDSSLFDIREKSNLIIFDVCRNNRLSEYNLLFYLDKLENLNNNVILDNIYRYWPVPIKKDNLLCQLENDFLNILSLNHIITYDDNYAILAKLIGYFYGVNIEVVYKGKNNIIKSFLSSSLNY